MDTGTQLIPPMVSAVCAGVTVVLSVIGLLRSAKQDKRSELRAAHDRIHELEEQLDRCEQENLRLMRRILANGGTK